MAEPSTVNVGLVVPNTGDLVNTWGSLALNPDFVAIDGFFGGVQTIAASSVPIVLTAPAGFTSTPGGGPTQAQNCVLRFTGALTSNVQVTLPMPGRMCIENLTTGAFVLIFAAASAGNVVAIDQGEIQDIENDGTNVKFINMGRVGKTEMWAGLTAMPAWVTACTVPPYLLNDGSIYNFSQFPALGARLKGQFGGNGTTTFGVPDSQGRVELPYDGTGTRITTAGSGINGQTIGAAGGLQTETLTRAQLPTGINVTGTLSANVAATTAVIFGTISTVNAASTPNPGVTTTISPASLGSAQVTSIGTATGTLTSNNTSGQAHPNVQPAQVVGISVIKT